MKKLIWISLLFFVSCKTASEIDDGQEPVYILIDGEHVEMVSDEFGNQYLKQNGFYIPFPFETDDADDSLHIYQAKIR